MIPLLAAGAISLLTQVTLLRELGVAYYGIELIYIIAFGFWLLGSGVGSLTAPSSQPATPIRLAVLFLIFSLILPLDVAFIRASRLIAGAVPGAYLALPVQIILLVVVLLPVAFLSGWLFIHSAALYSRSGGKLSAAYAIECIGALFGGLAATALLHFGVGNWSQTLLCALTAATVIFVSNKTPASPPLRGESGAHPNEAPASPPIGGSGAHNNKARITAMALSGLLVIGLITAPAGDRWMTGWTHPDLAATRDTPYGRITITGAKGQYVVYENDELVNESESSSAEEFAQIAALQVSAPESILVIGGGVEGLAPELLKLQPRHIDYLEINRALLTTLQQTLPDSALGWLDDARVHLIIADPRRFLNETDRQYDLILSSAPQPTSGQTNRYYTEEFFYQCCARLRPDAVFAFRLRSAENLWTPAMTRRNAGIYRALRRAFPSVLILPGTTNIVLASPDSLTTEPTLLGGRLVERGIPTRLVTPDYINYLYTNDRVAWMQNALDSTTATVNSDARPVAYSYGLLLWLAKFHPALAQVKWEGYGGGVGFWTLLAGGIIIAALLVRLVTRHGGLLRRGLLMAVAGMAGMFLETLLLLDYQTRVGVLYQNIGLLLTLFMAGMAAGAWLAGLAASEPPRPGWNYPAMAAVALITIAGGTAVGMLIITLSPVMLGTLLIAVGFLVGVIFSVAVTVGRGSVPALSGVPNENKPRTLSVVYAADLFGGCVGSLAASLLAIPLLGFSGTAGLTALLGVAAMILA
jgi:spermidine synthase